MAETVPFPSIQNVVDYGKISRILPELQNSSIYTVNGMQSYF